MKIRNGFVSNSSSSSFCLYGYSIYDIREFLEKIKNYIDNDKYKEIVCGIDDIDDIDDEDLEFCIDNIDEKYLEFYINDNIISVTKDYDENIFIGTYCTDIPENMTLIQMKDYIISVINKKFGIDIEKRKICWHEDCYMNN